MRLFPGGLPRGGDRRSGVEEGSATVPSRERFVPGQSTICMAGPDTSRTSNPEPAAGGTPSAESQPKNLVRSDNDFHASSASESPRGGLKLKPVDPSTASSAGTSETPSVPKGTPTVPSTAGSGPSEASPSSGGWRSKNLEARSALGFVNRCLGVAVIVLLILAGVHLWSEVMAMQPPSPPPPQWTPELWGPEIEVPPLDALLKSFEARPILRPAEGEGGTSAPSAAPVEPWAKKARERLDLIGFSPVPGSGEWEAIVKDTESQRMYFLRVGGTFPWEGTELRVVEMGPDSLQLSDGKEKLTVK